MSWESLTEDILGDFASHAGHMHDREINYLLFWKRRFREIKATYYAKLRVDRERLARHQAVCQRRERRRYLKLKQNPERYRQKLLATRAIRERDLDAARARHRIVSHRYWRKHAAKLAAHRAMPERRERKRRYDRARYLARKAGG